VLAKILSLDQKIAHAGRIILLGARPPARAEEVDAKLARDWDCEPADVHRVFVEAWRRLLSRKSEYQAVVVSQLDEIMRWDLIGKNRVAACLGLLKELRDTPFDSGPQKHEERVNAYRSALRDPDEALKEAMALEGLKGPLDVDGEEG
jgi:hypothetical protein